MKPKTTWVLIANGGEARMVQRNSENGRLEDIEGMAFENDHKPAREIMADKQGRAFDSVGGGRHAMEYSTDPAELAARQFARELAETLHKAHARNRYDHLVIAAPPAMMANLRQSLPKDVEASVILEITKDYTKTPVIDLPGRLEKEGAFG